MSSKQRGHKTLIMGGMFGGKTSMALLELRRGKVKGKNTVCIKWTQDDKRVGITTHNGQHIPAIEVAQLKDALLNDAVKKSEVVIIDEGHFFDDADEICDTLAADGKDVITTALIGDRYRKPFPVVARLMAKADKVIICYSICVICGKDTLFSYCRLTNSNAQGQKLVGGEEIYEPRCGDCWDKE